MKRTLLFFPEGPMITYTRDDIGGDLIEVKDLNPEKEIHFRLTPTELLRFGLRCIWRAMIS